VSDSTYTPSLPDRADVRADEREAYDRVVERQNSYRYDEFAKLLGSDTPSLPGTEIQPYFAALLNSPLIADHISELGVVYRTRGESPGSYAHADREWVDMVLAVELDMLFILFAHVLDAVAQGVRPQAVQALLDGRDDRLEPDELVLTQYIRQVVRGTVTPESWAAIVQRFGVRGAVEFTGFVAHLQMTIRLQQAFGIQDVSRAQLEALMERVLDGSAELPDPRAHIPKLTPA
jgi:hypothetical protein